MSNLYSELKNKFWHEDVRWIMHEISEEKDPARRNLLHKIRDEMLELNGKKIDVKICEEALERNKSIIPILEKKLTGLNQELKKLKEKYDPIN